MCGRFSLIRPAVETAELFGLPAVPEWGSRYNVAPTQTVFAIRVENGERALVSLRWGLIPPWSASPNDGPPLINARSETAAEKPTFRSAFRKRRCLVPADGFFEWKSEGGTKLPHYFTLASEGLFAVAGLWERWAGRDGAAVESVALLTTSANDLVRGCHDRMPVIVPPESYAAWLGDSDPALLHSLMVPYPAQGMAARAVGKAVGSPRNEGMQCLEPPGLAQALLF